MKKSLRISGLIAFAISAIMFVVGSTDSALTELYDWFWLPLPLGVILLIGSARIKK